MKDKDVQLLIQTFPLPDLLYEESRFVQLYSMFELEDNR